MSIFINKSPKQNLRSNKIKEKEFLKKRCISPSEKFKEKIECLYQMLNNNESRSKIKDIEKNLGNLSRMFFKTTRNI